MSPYPTNNVRLSDMSFEAFCCLWYHRTVIFLEGEPNRHEEQANFTHGSYAAPTL